MAEKQARAAAPSRSSVNPRYVQTLISPVDGSVVCERELATWDAASTVLDRAVAAQAAWKVRHVALAGAR